MAQVSRAEYFRNRRKDRKAFTVLVDREVLEALEKKLEEQGKSKAEWLREQISKELS